MVPTVPPHLPQPGHMTDYFLFELPVGQEAEEVHLSQSGYERSIIPSVHTCTCATKLVPHLRPHSRPQDMVPGLEFMNGVV